MLAFATLIITYITEVNIMNNVQKTITFTAFFALFLSTLFLMLVTNQIKNDMVFATCNQARVSPTINEKECGRLQDVWNREFLCSSNDTNPNTHCWVEQK
jgi:hypothetical protein